jgi:hypothetical protein
MLLAKLRERRGDGAETGPRGDTAAPEPAVVTGAPHPLLASEADV